MVDPLDQGETHPAQPANVKLVTSIDAVRKQGVSAVGTFEPGAAQALERMGVAGHNVGTDEPDHADLGKAEHRLHTKDASDFPVHMNSEGGIGSGQCIG